MARADGRRQGDVRARDMETMPPNDEHRHASLAEWMGKRRLMPQKRTRHVQWHGIGFKARTVVFVACVLFMMAFVVVSFCTGAKNGKWLYEASSTVMGWTFLPLAHAMGRSASTTVKMIGHGLESFVGIEIIAMFLATFVLSVLATAAITILMGIIRTLHYADDDGNVALLRGYDEQYRMGQMLK